MEFSGHEQAPAPGELSFKVPEGWIEEQPSSGMRKAQFRLPGDGGNDAELAVFSGIGGSVEQNVDRWINQFSRPDGSSLGDSAEIIHREVHGMRVTLVDASGTYTGSMSTMNAGGGAKDDYRLLAAVIETPSAPWYLKLTGPCKTVDRWESAFMEYVESAEIP